MIERDTLRSSLGAVLTGVAVTSGPWLLTTALLVLMRIAAVSVGIDAATSAERVITVVYATVIVLSAPIAIVVSRYTADRVYERRLGQIAAPLCRAVAVAIVGFGAVGWVATRLFEIQSSLAIPGAMLSAVVGAQWLLLSAAGGLASPAIILRAFAVGIPISGLAWFVVVPLGLGHWGYLFGFGAGQVVTLGVLLWGTLRVLPPDDDDTASLNQATRDYISLAVAALGFNAGLWIDKLCVLLLAGGEVASRYAALAAVAWLSIVPACAYLFVVIETAFHRRFEGFYDALSAGASLETLHQRIGELRAQVNATLRGAVTIQACVTLLFLVAAPTVMARLGLDGASSRTFLWLILGAGLQVVAFVAMLLLYYFDFREEALIGGFTQLLTTLWFTVVVGAPSEQLGMGYAAACAVTGAITCYLLLRRLPTLLRRTLLSQADATEG